MWEVRRSAMETNLLHFWNRCTEISRYFPVQPNTQQRRRGTPTNFSSFLVSLLRLSPPTFCSGIVTCKDGECTPTKWLCYLSSLHGWVVINRECTWWFFKHPVDIWGGGCLFFVCFRGGGVGMQLNLWSLMSERLLGWWKQQTK